MAKIQMDDIPWVSWSSPKGAFRSSYKELSIALGAKKDAPVGTGGHPFDLMIEKLAPGETSCPYHEHTVQWELFFIMHGTGTVRANDEMYTVSANDVIVHPPGEAHQITNTGDDELLYFIVADNPPFEVCRYPDSGKWGVFGENTRQLFSRPVDADYWNGEE